MPLTDLDQLRQVLDACDLLAVLGSRECGWLDVKNMPYLLDTDRGVAELLKDVAALANTSTGGILLIGYSTRLEHEEEIIDQLRPVPRARIDCDRYRKLLRDHVIPHLRGVRVRWLPAVTDADKGVLAIDVPGQPATALPFLVPATTRDGGQTLGVALPVRDGDSTHWMPRPELQRLLALGWSSNGATPDPIGVEVHAPSQMLTTVDASPAAIQEWLDGEERRLLGYLPDTTVKGVPASLASLVADLQRFKQVYAAVDPDRRSPEQYRHEVDSYLHSCGDRMPEAVRLAAAAHLPPIRLVVRNPTSSFLQAVRVEVCADDTVEFLLPRPGRDRAVNESFAGLPSAPTPFGRQTQLTAWAALARNPTPTLAIPPLVPRRPSRITIEEASRVGLGDFDLRAEEQRDLPPLCVLPSAGAEPITLHWRATCINRDGACEGTLTLPIAPQRLTLADILREPEAWAHDT